MKCSFCGSPVPRWRYPVGEESRLAREKCHGAIQREDREELLGRVLLAPVPRTLPDRYAPRFRQRARELHEEFWQTRSGRPELA